MGVNQSAPVKPSGEASKNAKQAKADALNKALDRCERIKTDTLNTFALVLQKFFNDNKANIPVVLKDISQEVHNIQDQLVKQKIIEQNWLNSKIKDANFEQRIMNYLMEGGPLSPFFKEDIDKIYMSSGKRIYDYGKQCQKRGGIELTKPTCNK